MSESDLYGKLCHFDGGIIIYEPHSKLGPRYQRHVQFVYVLEGSMEIDVDGHTRTLGPSEGTLLLPGHQESFRMDAHNRTRHGWFNSHHGELTGGLLNRLEHIPDTFPLTSRLRSTLQLIEPLYRKRHPNEKQEREYLAHTILCQVMDSERLQPATSQGIWPSPLEQAVRFMENSFAEPVGLREIAAAAGVSPAHLIRLFRKHLSQSPMQKLWELRVQEGRRLLETTGWSHAEIAHSCGFSTPAHFARKMKEAYGVPAKELRKTFWGKKDSVAGS